MNKPKLKKIMRTTPRAKEIWTAGAQAGVEMAFEIIFRQLEDLANTMGVKRRKERTPNAKSES